MDIKQRMILKKAGQLFIQYEADPEDVTPVITNAYVNKRAMAAAVGVGQVSDLRIPEELTLLFAV